MCRYGDGAIYDDAAPCAPTALAVAWAPTEQSRDPIGTQSTLAAPYARWTPRVSGQWSVHTPRTLGHPWHPWTAAADLPPHPQSARGAQGRGGRLPCQPLLR